MFHLFSMPVLISRKNNGLEKLRKPSAQNHIVALGPHNRAHMSSLPNREILRLVYWT